HPPPKTQPESTEPLHWRIKTTLSINWPVRSSLNAKDDLGEKSGRRSSNPSVWYRGLRKRRQARSPSRSRRDVQRQSAARAKVYQVMGRVPGGRSWSLTGGASGESKRSRE